MDPTEPEHSLLIMPPEIMLSRYAELLKISNDRLRVEGLYGKTADGVDVRNTIFWGADKICWPTDSRRAGCWSVPQAPMESKAFGPDTDSWMVLNRPRWLNSGTLIGPVKDVRDMFNATMVMVETEYDARFRDRNSDQYYFQDVWAEQEVARIKLRDGGIRPPTFGLDSNREPILGRLPAEPNGRRTEYGISIDYASRLFQTAAGYTEYLTWTTFNDTTPTPADLQRRRRLDEVTLPSDIEASPPPFHISDDQQSLSSGIPTHRGWHDVSLGINVVTQTVFPLLHFTGDKVISSLLWIVIG